MKSTAFRECIRYCVPSVLGMLGLSCYILADTFFIANGIGTDGLAALNLALPVYSLIHGVGLMLEKPCGYRRRLQSIYAHHYPCGAFCRCFCAGRDFSCCSDYPFVRGGCGGFSNEQNVSANAASVFACIYTE